MEATSRRRLILLSRRRAVVGLAGLSAAASASLARGESVTAPLATKLNQGGFLIGRSQPRATLAVDGAVVGKASASGLYVIGFDRDAPPRASVGTLAPGSANWVGQDIAIAPVSYDVQRIDGLPPETVTPTDPAITARITADREKKTQASASRDDTDNFKDGFILPLEHPVRTSPFGVQRVLNGEPKQPHYGVDLAAPQGTPIRAPAAGLVVLAEPDMFLEGGLTMIDHGQGLITYYLHQSRQVVRAGERVSRYQLIGEVGMKGRATGPHLCWRMSWRGRHMDPSLMVGAAAPGGLG